ncbi:hypothetical protein V6N11_026706 [Hibiscus sabdariffa]|uniref:Uncharacterized protein n=1 Tax=Hibiscus sabdariffa TaxID=183260 RepID=A0ABR2SWF6_9ROSI
MKDLALLEQIVDNRLRPEGFRSAGRQDTYSFAHKEPVTRSRSFNHQVDRWVDIQMEMLEGILMVLLKTSHLMRRQHRKCGKCLNQVMVVGGSQSSDDLSSKGKAPPVSPAPDNTGALPTASAAFPGWQNALPHGTGFGLQYYPNAMVSCALGL